MDRSNECTVSPVFWGWIPHLGVSFDQCIDVRVFRTVLKQLSVMNDDGILVRVNDYRPDSDIIVIKFDNIDNFEYDQKSLRGSVEVRSDIRIDCDITVYSDGLVKFEVDKSKSDGRDKNIDKRLIVRELYFLFKKLFHEDIYHKSEDTHNTEMSESDDTLSIVECEGRADAVQEIYNVFLKKINSIGKLHADDIKTKMDYLETDKILMGYKVFGDSYIESCVVSSMQNKYHNILDLNYQAVSGLLDYLKNRKMRSMQDLVNRWTVPLGILTMIISVFAGSLFYGYSLDNFPKNYEVIFLIISFVVPLIFMFSYFIIRWYRHKFS